MEKLLSNYIDSGSDEESDAKENDLNADDPVRLVFYEEELTIHGEISDSSSPHGVADATRERHNVKSPIPSTTAPVGRVTINMPRGPLGRPPSAPPASLHAYAPSPGIQISPAIYASIVNEHARAATERQQGAGGGGGGGGGPSPDASTPPTSTVSAASVPRLLPSPPPPGVSGSVLSTSIGAPASPASHQDLSSPSPDTARPLSGDLPTASPFRPQVFLPPEPVTSVEEEVKENIMKLWRKKQQGTPFNSALRRHKEFRNPAILEKLVEFWGIDEIGSNYPKDKFDPHDFQPHEFYDELAKQQRDYMEKLQEDRSKRTKVDFISSETKQKPIVKIVDSRRSDAPSSQPDTSAPPNSGSQDSSSGSKRKSKWDEPSQGFPLHLQGLLPLQRGGFMPAPVPAPVPIPGPTTSSADKDISSLKQLNKRSSDSR